jgi:hypothetical protein
VSREEFLAFATELGERFKSTGSHWVVIVAPPGSFTSEAGPHSASNMPIGAQIETLRGIAASLESNEAVEFIRKRL